MQGRHCFIPTIQEFLFTGILFVYGSSETSAHYCILKRVGQQDYYLAIGSRGLDLCTLCGRESFATQKKVEMTTRCCRDNLQC
jgi:hypothetical protein